MDKKRNINLLFTSIGRRVELIQAFRSAALRLNVFLRIYGADCIEDAPALFYCDVRKKVCPIHEAAYIPELVEICTNEDIDLIIPTIDTDLLLLSQVKKRFEQIGTRVLISASEKISLCRDKRLTAQYFASCGLMTPVPVDDWRQYQGKYPCFIKPMDGSSSINAYKIESVEELEFYAKKISNYIIQPYIEGTEYTVDIFCDFNGNPIYITPRERLKVRDGEVIKTRILADEEIVKECLSIIETFCPIGPMTVQLIRHKMTGRDYYIEINPRFGGGAPLSIKAGADSARALLQLLLGQSVCFQDKVIGDGVTYCRFDQNISFPVNSQTSQVKAVIFDLDDTLYSEKDYIRSGFDEICNRISELKDAQTELWSAFENGEAAIDFVLKRRKCYSEELKERCLLIYRLHKPQISLYPKVEELLIRLKTYGIHTGIITDGRIEGQETKLNALNLQELVDEIIITDKIGGACFRKPNDISFRIMKDKLMVEYSEMLYIGDNLSKDFIAPQKLGMKWLYFNNKEGIYYSDIKSLQENSVNSIDEIESYVFHSKYKR